MFGTQPSVYRIFSIAYHYLFVGMCREAYNYCHCLLFFRAITYLTYMSSSSSSYELFFVSFMQEDVYMGHIALALTLGLQVFS